MRSEEGGDFSKSALFMSSVSACPITSIMEHIVKLFKNDKGDNQCVAGDIASCNLFVQLMLRLTRHMNLTSSSHGGESNQD